jgi:alpha-ketoglutarate-dependent taurine dioxygenase
MLKPKRTFQPSSLPKANICIEISQNAVVEQTFLAKFQEFPLVFKPTVPGVDLLQWAAANRELIENSVLSYGGVLFRGFDVPSPQYFQHFATVVGESPVTYAANIFPLPETDKKSWRAALIRPELRLKWHIDDSYDGFGGPKKIMFYSHLEAAEGGETPICDLRRMFQSLDPEIRRKFVELGIVYVRNYYPQFGMDWRQEFGTTSPDELEAICQRRQTELEWVDGRLRTRAYRPAVIRHAKTGDTLWYNLVQMWHPLCNEPGVLASWRASFKVDDYPMNVFYGDGSPIPDEVMEHIYSLYEKLGVSFLWQHSDIMVLDNFSTAHARKPFKGSRQLYVALDKVLLLDELPPGYQLRSQEWELNPV